MPAFIQQKNIRFQHCDPAGLIFYPKAFELVGEVIEDWFTQWSGRTPHEFHSLDRRSLPTVKTTCEFFDQVRVSDQLQFVLVVRKVGRSSIELEISALRADKPCFSVSSTLVQVQRKDGGQYSALPFTDDIRSRLLGYVEAALSASEGP